MNNTENILILGNQNQQGFWPFTASVDWCEYNYTVSFYVAEFWNTISNLVIMFFALYGIYTSLRVKSEKFFILAHFFIFVVGIGSFIFHCTLTWEGQLLDEIPMIFTSMPILYSIAGLKLYDINKKKILRAILILYPILLIPVYVVLKHYEIFLVGYAITVWTMIFWCYNQGKYLERIAHNKSIHKYPNQPINLYWKSLYAYGGAFVLWVLDQVFCDQLNNLKVEVGPFLAPLFEFHAIWHFGSGYGTYLMILSQQCSYSIMWQFNEEFQRFNKDKQYRYKVDYAFSNWLPYIRNLKSEDEEYKYMPKVE